MINEEWPRSRAINHVCRNGIRYGYTAFGTPVYAEKISAVVQEEEVKEPFIIQFPNGGRYVFN
jgi:hypothetical protein